MTPAHKDPPALPPCSRSRSPSPAGPGPPSPIVSAQNKAPGSVAAAAVGEANRPRGCGQTGRVLTSARCGLLCPVLGRRPAAVNPRGSTRLRGAWGRASSALVWLGHTVPSVRPAVRLLSLGRRSVRPSVRHRRRGAASCTATPRRMQDAPPRPEPPPLPPSLRAVTRAPALRRAPAPAPTRAAAAVPAPPARPPPLHFPAPGPGAGSRPRAAPSLLPATNAPDPLVPSGPVHPLGFAFSILYWSSRLPSLLRHGLLLPHCPVLSRPLHTSSLPSFPFPLLSALSVYSLPPSNPPVFLLCPSIRWSFRHLFLGLSFVHHSSCFTPFPSLHLPVLSSLLPSILTPLTTLC